MEGRTHEPSGGGRGESADRGVHVMSRSCVWRQPAGARLENWRHRFAPVTVAPVIVLLACLVVGGASAESLLVGVVSAALVLGTGLLTLRAAASATRRSSELDEQLMQSRKMAAIGEMSSGIAHELNTPLGIITQEVEWLRHLLKQHQPEGTGDFVESLDQVDAQVRRCAEITHGMLNFAKTLHLVEQSTDINRLVDDMSRWVERDVEGRNIRFTRLYDETLPEIATDAPMLRHVVLNLLNNAAQAVAQDGVVTLTTSREECDVLIQVADTGPGVPDSIKESIFHPFFTTKPPGKGTGLGLAISLSIVNKLGGTIHVESEPGNGACFTVRLPLKKATTDNGV